MKQYDVEIIKTVSGYPTARITFFDYTIQKQTKIYLCSKMDPIKEAENWAINVYQEDISKFIVYGLGMGYHIEALSRLLKTGQQLYVIETNLEVANALKPYVNISSNSKIKFVITQDLKKIAHIIEHSNMKQVFEIYTPCMKIIPNQVEGLRSILEYFKIRYLNYGEHTTDIQRNYSYHRNKNYSNISQFYGMHKDKPIFIISAGPSLDQNINYLKQVGRNDFIFSTGRSLKALIEKNVRVDMFCIIDPLVGTMPQIEGLENLNIPFVFLNTAYYKTVENYKGPKYIGYSMDSDKNKEGWIETGGSVATAMLDIAIKMGGNPIIFVGQDLAYTNGLSHCQDARATRAIDATVMKKVKNANGEYIPTTSGLLSFRYWIQSKIKKHPNVTFYNCSEGGAYIEGCIHKSLRDVLEIINSNDNGK